MIKAIHNNVVLQKKVKQGQKGIYMPSMGDDRFYCFKCRSRGINDKGW